MNLQEAYMTMQNEFEKNVPVGSKVRIVRRAKNKEPGWNSAWDIGEMNSYFNKIGYITYYGRSGIKIEFITMPSRSYFFPFFILEVLEVKQPEPEFKPFDQVLVRDESKRPWKCGFFSHKHNGPNVEFPYETIHMAYRHCIPYKGNEHLVGTTISPGA